ncbi:hypothetical protein SAMN04488137_1097 [Fictibacillus solisalsi]|uniref:Uncharacterized protein n=1 Tax=Fictibacillus solisalsi TaxID=459525 RepID=A0A1G9URF5_9BACL|nr:hypothetical protein [Fictibacillus solisalsi]SDM62509.1 hypothetical protein SAMN04488137_1097 [Fictibacillus solisalsi]
MNLDDIWFRFLTAFRQADSIVSIEKKLVAGLPFLYILTSGTISEKMIEEMIKQEAIYAMKGKRINAEMIYVRKEAFLFVYRFRFLVPQEKMFCCGNLCEDCIRYQSAT